MDGLIPIYERHPPIGHTPIGRIRDVPIGCQSDWLGPLLKGPAQAKFCRRRRGAEQETRGRRPETETTRPERRTGDHRDDQTMQGDYKTTRTTSKDQQPTVSSGRGSSA